MSELRADYITAAAPLVTSESVTLITSRQWAEVLRVLQTASNQHLAAVVVTFPGGVPHVGSVIAMESCRKS